MEEQSTGFRSAVVGGFRREDVMAYIERTDQEYHDATEGLQRRLTELQTAVEELQTLNESLTEKNAELLERLGQMTLNVDDMRRKMEKSEQELIMQMAEIEAQRARAADLAAENDRLMAENQRMLDKCGEYDMAKDKIAEIELSAYRRARQIQQNATEELRKLYDTSTEMIDGVTAQLNAAREYYTDLAARSQEDASAMSRKADSFAEEIERIRSELESDSERVMREQMDKLHWSEEGDTADAPSSNVKDSKGGS